MAKKEEKSKIVLERTYNVPLRREFLKTANWKRSKKAMKALKEFLVKHMKPLDMDIRNIRVGKHLNEYVWRHGIRNPPHHVKLVTTKDEKGIVKATLVGAPVEKVKDSKKDKKSAKKEEVKVIKREVKKEETKKEENKEQVKEEESKEAIKDIPKAEPAKEIVDNKPSTYNKEVPTADMKKGSDGKKVVPPKNK